MQQVEKQDLSHLTGIKTDYIHKGRRKELIRISKKRMLITIGIVIIIILILLGISVNRNKTDYKLKIGGDDLSGDKLKIENINDYIKFPTLQGTYNIDADWKYFSLVNHESNDVYIQMTVSENGEVVCVSDWIEPNKEYRVEAYDLFSAGEHRISIKMETKDIATGMNCTGLVADATVIVKK